MYLHLFYLGPRISYHLYLRLALLMGLTWLAGLVAGVLDLEPVWYVFLVLNTLQVPIKEDIINRSMYLQFHNTCLYKISH